MKLMPDRLFRTEERKETYLNLYQSCLAKWPVPLNEYSLDTTFGKTGIIESGGRQGKPLLLFICMLASPASWYPNIGPLSEKYRVLSVSYPGDLGTSNFMQSPQNAEQAACWLNEILNLLDISSPLPGPSNPANWQEYNVRSLYMWAKTKSFLIRIWSTRECLLFCQVVIRIKRIRLYES